jgi:hypothetical protein
MLKSFENSNSPAQLKKGMEQKISIDSELLGVFEKDQAIEFADSVLGEAGRWSPTILSYRLSSDFQKDWKIEVGRWLLTAERFDFLGPLKSRLIRATNDILNPQGSGAEQSTHVILLSELAAAKIVYYLTNTGWKFLEWEPKIEKGDVDIRLISPSGITTDIQVKCPNGDQDDWVASMVDKAAKQLANSPGPARMIVLAPRNTWGTDLNSLAPYVIGSAIGNGQGYTSLKKHMRGIFGDDCNKQLTSVCDIQLVRGINETLYRSTVFLNPWCNKPSLLNIEDFQGARVCTLIDNKFIWFPEEPFQCGALPNGTEYIEI